MSPRGAEVHLGDQGEEVQETVKFNTWATRVGEEVTRKVCPLKGISSYWKLFSGQCEWVSYFNGGEKGDENEK